MCLSDNGPNFGGCALGLGQDPLNKEDGGYCNTKGGFNGDIYGIKSDGDGNHEVTGEGQKQKDNNKGFTCLEIEVYGVTF